MCWKAYSRYWITLSHEKIKLEDVKICHSCIFENCGFWWPEDDKVLLPSRCCYQWEQCLCCYCDMECPPNFHAGPWMGVDDVVGAHEISRGSQCGLRCCCTSCGFTSELCHAYRSECVCRNTCASNMYLVRQVSLVPCLTPLPCGLACCGLVCCPRFGLCMNAANMWATSTERSSTAASEAPSNIPVDGTVLASI